MIGAARSVTIELYPYILFNLLAVARNGDLHLLLHTYHPHHQIRDECKEGEIDTLMAA